MPGFVRAPARGLLLALLLTRGAALGAQDTSGSSLSTNGLPGIIVTPVAGSLPVGWFAVGVNNFPNFNAFWGGPSFSLGRQHNGYLAFNLFSWLSVSTRVSDLIPLQPRRIITVGGPGGVLTLASHAIDLSPNVQVLLAPQQGLRPGLAVGAYDVTGTGLLHAHYAVASEALGSVGQISAGYGVGPAMLNGLFGSAEVHPTPWSTVEGEWDGKRINAGIGLKPPLPPAVTRYVLEPQINALWADGKGWYLDASLGLPWDGAVVQRPASRPRASASPEPRPSWGTPSDLADELAAQGFENVSAEESDSAVRVRYEDRVDLRNALDGLTRVLGLVARQDTAPIRRAEITILSSERPVLYVTATAAWLRAFRNGEARGFAGTGLQFSYPSGDDAGQGGWGATPDRSSRGKADLVLLPTLSTHVAWENGLADGRIGLVPTLEVPLYPGLYAALGYGVPLWQSRGMIVTMGPLPNPSLDFATLGYIWNRALSPQSDLAVHWSGGRFDGGWEGVRQQAALLLGGGILRLDADAAVTRAVGEGGESAMGVVGARVLIPGIETRLWVKAGRYLYGDRGMSGGVSRFFGDAQLTLSVESTQNGTQGTFAVAIPLAGARGLRPALVRPRLPMDWSNGESVGLYSLSGTGDVALNVAQELQNGADMWDRFFDRDRLNPAAAAAAMAGPRFGGGQ